MNTLRIIATGSRLLATVEAGPNMSKGENVGLPRSHGHL